jgi:hypothetical protein
MWTSQAPVVGDTVLHFASVPSWVVEGTRVIISFNNRGIFFNSVVQAGKTATTVPIWPGIPSYGQTMWNGYEVFFYNGGGGSTHHYKLRYNTALSAWTRAG